MVGFKEFDLFSRWRSGNQKDSTMELRTVKGYENMMHLDETFFREVILSKITTTSHMHPVYCLDSPPSHICQVREGFKDDNLGKPTAAQKENIHRFISAISSEYDPSLTVLDVLSSCTFSLFTFFTEEKGKYISIAWVLYFCDPCLGLVVPFLYVTSDYRKNGVGCAILQTLQYFSTKAIGQVRTLVWLTKLSEKISDDLVRFYIKMGFHPAIPSNYALCHVFPASLVRSLHEADNNAQLVDNDFLLECDVKIRVVDKEVHYKKRENISTVCSICNFEESSSEKMVFCKNPLPKSFTLFGATKKKQSRVCGLVLCVQCHSNFGCESVDRCPLHHETVQLPKTQKAKMNFYERESDRLTSTYSSRLEALLTDKDKFFNFQCY